MLAGKKLYIHGHKCSSLHYSLYIIMLGPKCLLFDITLLSCNLSSQSHVIPVDRDTGVRGVRNGLIFCG